MMISTAFGNGIFEEILWRGAYLKLFPENIWIRIIWASIWFALWHYVPGSISKDGNPIPLMIGSLMFGFVLSFTAHKTKSIWWCIVSHIVGGLIMVS
jgi:membrane protease YdiL (CAAX protease family)